MREEFDDLVLGHPIDQRTRQMQTQLLGTVGGDQRRNRDHAAIPLGQTGALPHVAEQHLVGQLDELRGNLSNALFRAQCGGLGHGSHFRQEGHRGDSRQSVVRSRLESSLCEPAGHTMRRRSSMSRRVVKGVRTRHVGSQ